MDIAVRKFIIILIILCFCYFLYAFLKYVGSVIIVIIAQKTIKNIRQEVDLKLKNLPLNYFDTNSYGDILSRITNDIDTISNALQQSMEQIVTAVTTLIMIFIMMLVISPILTLIGIITVPLALYISMRIVNYSQIYFQEQQNVMGELNGYVEEMYTGHNLITAYSKETDVIDDFNRINNELKKMVGDHYFFLVL